MFKSNLKITFRNLWSNKGYTFLNLLGLTIGITCCLILFQYVSFEKSYDNFQKKTDQIVRLRMDIHDQGRLTMQSATVPSGIAPLLKKDLPEVENYCRLVDARISWSMNQGPTQYNIAISNDEKNIKAFENKGYYADPSALGMLNIPLISGDSANSLNGPDKMILSERMAKKYFGEDNPVGKKLTVREGGQHYYYEVTGVFRNYPANSHLVFDYLISYKTFDNLVHLINRGSDPEIDCGWYDFYDYIQLAPGADLKQFASKLPAFCDKYMNLQWNKIHNVHLDLYVIPLKDIHLYSNYNEEAEVNGDGKSVSFLFLVSFIIIGIAWINYTNLATARSLERAREVGVRKLLGAAQFDLIKQFLVESFLMNLLALILAIAIALLFTSSFDHWIGKESINSFNLPISYWEGFFLLFLLGTFISGIYPAFILSSYNPVTVLKGMFKNTGKGHLLRKGLIIGQFTLSIILISGTIIIYQQVSFMRKQKLGANIEQTIVLNGAASIPDSVYINSFASFKNNILEVNNVKNITASSDVLGKEIYYTTEFELLKSGAVISPTFYFIFIDYDFIPSYDMQVTSGRNFSKDFTTDKKTAILNEEAAHSFGFENPQDAINKLTLYNGDTIKIIGVVANFHQQGLNKAINPILFMLRPDARNYYSIKFRTSSAAQTIGSIERVWNQHFPADPFSYFFLDESFDHQYKSDLQFGKIFGLFAFLAILIACFGLLSLSAYNVIQRTKEIGVRKVLGANVRNIVILLSKDFIILVLIGILIATPITWYIMKGWLMDFAFRISIHWWVFILAGSVAILIALLTVSYQAIKVAVSKPMTNLRTE